jgi:hypothetical protein
MDSLYKYPEELTGEQTEKMATRLIQGRVDQANQTASGRVRYCNPLTWCVFRRNGKGA